MANTVNDAPVKVVRNAEQVGWQLPDGSLVNLTDPWPTHHDPLTWLPVYVDNSLVSFLEAFRCHRNRAISGTEERRMAEWRR